MKKLKTLTIGIPAFNEEANIGYLLQRLVTQKISSGVLEKIVVVSDGSTDRTAKIVKNINDKRILLIEQPKRLGMYTTQNKILENTDSDILVMFDADVLPNDELVIENMIKPIIKNKNVGMVGALTESFRQNNFFEKIIANSHSFKYGLYSQVRKGNNMFMCHGRGRAFSKKFYKKFFWPTEGPEDAISYFLCVKNKMKFVLAKNAVVLFKSPMTFADHAKQSMRFEKDIKIIKQMFGEKVVHNELEIEVKLLMYHLAKFIIFHPISFFAYGAIMARIKFFSNKKSINFSTWEIAYSSKKII